MLLLNGAASHAENSPIIAEISAAQAGVKTNEIFLVSATLRNRSADTQFLSVWSCSYPQQWISDNPAVHVAPASCKKDAIVRVRLPPGEAYKQSLSIYFAGAAKYFAGHSITFRLGFKPVTAAGGKMSAAIWSNALTLDVIEDAIYESEFLDWPCAV